MKLASLVPLLLLVAADKDPYAKLASLTVDQFARKMEKRDDDLTTTVLFSTQAGYRKTRSSGGWLFGTDSDLYLKASIDKRTRQVAYVVAADASWIGSFAIWRTATFTTPGGPREANVLNGVSRLGTCTTGGCIYAASIGVAVDESIMREIAATDVPWRFRFRSTTGAEFENAIAPVEVRAILAAVDAAR